MRTSASNHYVGGESPASVVVNYYRLSSRTRISGNNMASQAYLLIFDHFFLVFAFFTGSSNRLGR